MDTQPASVLFSWQHKAGESKKNPTYRCIATGQDMLKLYAINWLDILQDIVCMDNNLVVTIKGIQGLRQA